MKEKWLIRAASKFRQWMIKESQQPPDTLSLLNEVHAVTVKSSQIEKWTQRFIKGMTQRMQVSPYPPNNRSYGIVTPSAYEDIATHMVPDICEDMACNLRFISDMMKSIADPTESVVTPLSARDAYEEILVIQKMWPDTKYRDGILSIVIENVVLEDGKAEVYLGDFRIQLSLNSPLVGLSVESLSHIKSECGFYHPHMRGNNLCTGDGGLPMNDALCQGRLEDYFRIVETILRTYNDGSPYESLTEWYDPQHENQFYCESCDEWRNDEDMYCCERCDHTYCESCETGGGCCIDCSEWRCGECSQYCENCRNHICNNCHSTCCNCHDSMCEDCTYSCGACEECFCSACCSQNCANCGDRMCENCTVTCGCCGDNACSNCVKEKCGNCDRDICNGCETACEECSEVICETCKDNKCEDCGNLMCGTCLEGHTCLSTEV